MEMNEYKPGDIVPQTHRFIAWRTTHRNRENIWKQFIAVNIFHPVQNVGRRCVTCFPAGPSKRKAETDPLLKALNALLDVRSNLCYTQINVEQDHNFDGDSYRAFYGSGGSCREIVHPHQRAKSKGLSTKLLR